MAEVSTTHRLNIRTYGGQEFAETFNQINQALRQNKIGVDDARRATSELAKESRLYSGQMGIMRSEYRLQHQGLYDTISVMRNVGAVGNTVLQMWNAYNISQIRVKQATDSVAEAQERLNTALELYGENSAAYQAAEKALEDAERAANRARGDQVAGFIGMGLSAVTAAANVLTLYTRLDELGKIQDLTVTVKSIVSGLTDLDKVTSLITTIGAGLTLSLAVTATAPAWLAGLEVLLYNLTDGKGTSAMSGLLPEDMHVTQQEIVEKGADAYTEAFEERREAQLQEWLKSEEGRRLYFESPQGKAYTEYEREKIDKSRLQASITVNQTNYGVRDAAESVDALMEVVEKASAGVGSSAMVSRKGYMER